MVYYKSDELMTGFPGNVRACFGKVRELVGEIKYANGCSVLRFFFSTKYKWTSLNTAENCCWFEVNF